PRPPGDPGVHCSCSGFSAGYVVLPGRPTLLCLDAMRRRDRRSLRPRPGRASAALAALVFVLTGVLGMAHEATTSHVRCAAHGELVDSEGVSAVVVGPARGTIASSTIANAPLLARGHGDEHCLLASAVRASRIAPRPPTLIAAI